jgi:trimethylamine:corrinoid methyltransferase-like protein
MNMQPNITLLSDELVKQILDEAFQLLIMPGIKVQSPAAMQLLEDAGAQVDLDTRNRTPPVLSLRSLRQTES